MRSVRKGVRNPPRGGSLKVTSRAGKRKGKTMSSKERTTYETRGVEVRERAFSARGGVSLGTIITGGLVAIGAFFLLSSIVGAVLSKTAGVTAEELARGDAVEAGVAGGIALLVAWFLSFTWGGYTAGRMGRGSGFLNGLLVPIGVIVLAAVVGAIAWALGSSESFSLPSPTQRLQVEGEYTSVDYGIALAAITLGVMFLGSVVGGLFGARWHTKLERRAEADRYEDRLEAQRTDEVDITEREAAAERERAVATTGARDVAAQPPPATYPAGPYGQPVSGTPGQTYGAPASTTSETGDTPPPVTPNR
jgi:hypothetical protein